MSSSDVAMNDASLPPKPVTVDKPGRLPSLNQLAARMNIAAPNGAPQATSGSRPRLAASLLRTGSSVSVNTTTSTVDSMAVNAPSTRSASNASGVSSRDPSPAASLRAGSVNGVPEIPDGEPLTEEKLEKHDQMDTTIAPLPSEKRVKVGYKNVPSLEVITKRMALTRSLSIDGTAKPPEPETYEDPMTPGVLQKAPEHPLQYKWTIFYDTKARVGFTPSNPSGTFPAQPPPVPTAVDTEEYEAGLNTIGDFDTVESFCRYFNWLKPPSLLERNSNYHLFKTGIKPMWEDPANANGGKWVLTMKNNPQLLDRCWSWLTMAMVGEELDEGNDVCGAVVSLKAKVDRIQLWVRSKESVDKVNNIGKRLVKLLDISEADGIGMEFQFNSDDRPPPNKYLSIQASFPQSGFRSTFAPGAPGAKALAPVAGDPGTGNLGANGAFAQFGGGSNAFAPGAGAFGGGWRGAKRG